MNEIYDIYLHGMNVYYSIIPNKNYFIKDNDKHLFINYDDMISLLNYKVKNMEYIDIFNCLSVIQGGLDVLNSIIRLEGKL